MVQTQQHEQWLRDTRRFWDAGSAFEAKYRRICSDSEIDQTDDEDVLASLWEKRTREEFAYLFDGLAIRKDWTCLEIGCGIGRLMKPVARQCRHVIGIDLSEKMVDLSAEYLRDVPNTEVHVNDGCSLRMIPDGSIDLVYSHLAFQHITVFEVVEGYLREIARVLKKGGYCRIQCWREAPVPLLEGVKNLARSALGRVRYHGPRCWQWAPGRSVRFGGVTFHPPQWRHLLADCGLEVRTVQLGLGHENWMWTTSRKA